MIEDIQQAKLRIGKYLTPTPLIHPRLLSRRISEPVGLKLELFQPTGSFKVRPAFNGMLAHLDQARSRGVVTSSSGNFAQAVAYAARSLGVSAQIVMMSNASSFKRERTERLGAEVVLCGNTFQDRWETTFRVQQETGRLLLHPYDSQETIAGDGTIGLELLDQISGDFCVVVPVSGGGLISGIASSVKALRPGCRVIGVQPAANGSMPKSLEQGGPVAVTPAPSLADALAVARPGERTFPIIRRLVDDVVTVEEEEIAAAIRILAEEQKVVVEGGGAAGVAALLAGKVSAQKLPIVCVLSGGNIFPEKLAAILGGRRDENFEGQAR